MLIKRYVRFLAKGILEKELFTNGVINQSRYSELMPVSIVDTCLCHGEMNMASAAYRYHAAASPFENMEMVFIKISPEFNFMNVIVITNRYCLTGNSRESMIMRVFFEAIT